jgi:hypothetical protein
MDPNLMFSQVTAGAAFAYLLRLIQRWDKLPWVTQHTQGITIAVRLILSGLATIGISWQWNSASHSLTIGGLQLWTITLGLWHWFGQYALQHGWGQVFNIGTLQKVETPVVVTNVKGDSVGSVQGVGK